MLAYCHDAGGSLLSSSPRTVISLFLSVVGDVDNARGRCTAHGKRTKAARRRTTARPRMERTGAVENAPVQSQDEGSMRVDWLGRGCMLGLTSPENRGRDWPTLEGTYGREAEAQPAMGGGSRRSRRCWFGFGGWRKKRLKKHDRCWMSIQRLVGRIVC